MNTTRSSAQDIRLKVSFVSMTSVWLRGRLYLPFLRKFTLNKKFEKIGVQIYMALWMKLRTTFYCTYSCTFFGVFPCQVWSFRPGVSKVLPGELSHHIAHCTLCTLKSSSLVSSGQGWRFFPPKCLLCPLHVLWQIANKIPAYFFNSGVLLSPFH